MIDLITLLANHCYFLKGTKKTNIKLSGAVAQNKAITLLTILVISFCIATIVLAVEKSNAIDDLNDCKTDGTTTTTTETTPPLPQV